jgi:ABC-type Fe3+/spermidine/putrescine transport system ATPase subunit
MRGVARAERYVHLERVSEVVGLRKKLYRRPAQLCRVQDRRVALVRAPVSEKLFCLRGESLSKLGAQLRHEMRVEIRRPPLRLGLTSVSSEIKGSFMIINGSR